MNLYEEILKNYPDLDLSLFDKGRIVLRDDSDGEGAYIEKWDCELPIPKGMKIGK